MVGTISMSSGGSDNNAISELERRIFALDSQLLDLRQRTGQVATDIGKRLTLAEKKVRRVEDFLSADVQRFNQLRVRGLSAITGTIGGWDITSTTIQNAADTVELRGAGNLAFGATPPTSATVGTGIFIDSTGIYGLSANTQEFYIKASDGKGYFGAGNAVLDSTGITISNNASLSITSALTSAASLDAIEVIMTTSGTGSLQGMHVNAKTSGASTPAVVRGIRAGSTTQGSGGATFAAGVQGKVIAQGTAGTIAEAYAGHFFVSLEASDSITNAYGVLGIVEKASGTGAITTSRGGYFRAQDGTNNRGVEIAGPTSGANNYSIYATATAQSIHAGNIRIGSAVAPTVALDVEGVALVSQGVRTKVSPYYDVKAYGAVGDGITDDTTAINNAIVAAADHGTVWFPPGTYKITATLGPAINGSRLQGAGNRVSIISQAMANIPILQWGGYGSAIADLGFTYASAQTIAQTAAVGIELYAPSWSTIDRVRVINCNTGFQIKQAGTLVGGGGGTINYIASCSFRDIFVQFTNYGMELTAFSGGSSGCVFENIYLSAVTSSTVVTVPLNIAAMTDSVFSQINIENCKPNISIQCSTCKSLSFSSVHFEQVYPNSNYNGFFFLNGGTYSLNGVSLAYCGVLVANIANEYSIIRVGSDTQVMLNGLREFSNTVTSPNFSLLQDSSISTTNLCLNGGFETNTTGWAGTGTGTITRITTDHAYGNASAEVVILANLDGCTYSHAGDATQQAYTYSFWLKAKTAGDVGKSVTSFLQSTGGVLEIIASQTNVLTAGWTRFTGTGTWANAGHTGFLLVLRDQLSQGAFSFRVDAVQHEVGSSLSPTVVETDGAAATGNSTIVTSRGVVTYGGVTKTGSFNVSNRYSTLSTPLNPTGTTSTTGVMMGLSGAITPNITGNVHVTVSGNIDSSLANSGARVGIRMGTGSAPSNASAIKGTAYGSQEELTGDPANANKYPFSLTAMITGLAVGTTYWIDVSLAAITAGTATISSVSISAFEES